MNIAEREVDDRGLSDLRSVGFLIRPNGWPVREKWQSRWCHSDMKDVAYFYNFKLYETIVERGALQ